MRTFRLVRKEDVSGVSGTGVIAEGVEWENKRVTLSWLGKHHTTENLDSIQEVEDIHGHEGRTEVVWDAP